MRSSLRASSRGVTSTPATNRAASSMLKAPKSRMNSEVITSTFTGTLISSWLVRLPMSVVVACHDLSSVSETVNGDSEITSSAAGAVVVAVAGGVTWARAETAANKAVAAKARKSIMVGCGVLTEFYGERTAE